MTDEETIRRVQNHESLLFGDPLATPRRPGVVEAMDVIFKIVNHGESGNEALHKRAKELEQAEVKRTAFIAGAIAVCTLVGGVVGWVLHR